MYLTGINFFMLFYNFQLDNEWMPWYMWLSCFAVMIIIVHYIDTHLVWEDEQREFAIKNPVLMEILDIVRGIRNRIEK